VKTLLTSWAVRLNALAVGAVVAAVALRTVPWLPLALALTVFAVSGWRNRHSVAELRVSRTLAALAVLIDVWYADGAERWPLLTAGMLIALCLAYSDILQRVLHIGYLEAVNLAVERTAQQRFATPPAITAAMNGLTVAYVLVAAAPVGLRPMADLLFMSAAAVVLGWTASVVVENYLRRQAESHPVDAAVMAAVEELRPRFVIHFAGARRSEYQLQMWLPYFEAVGDPYMIIVRDRYLLAGVAGHTDAPIVVVPAQSVLDKLLPASVRSCFYVNHAVKNIQLIKLDNYVHVQLMHGDSDKAISRSPVSLVYDRVFVAGQAGIDRYHRHGVDIPDYKFRTIGRPQLHDIRVGPRAAPPGTLQSVLYTPTWTGLTEDVNYSSLEQGRRIVEALLRRDVAIVFRSHPYTRTNAAYQALAEDIASLIAADAAATGRPHRWGRAAETDMTLGECINATDACISDISGTASDWLYCGRPFAMTDPRGFGDRYFEEFPLARAAYLLEPDAANIEDVLDELLTTDSRALVRGEVREYYLGDIAPDDLIGVFRDAVRATYEPTAPDGPAGPGITPVNGWPNGSPAGLADQR
jgi:hypothetical protein